MKNIIRTPGMASASILEETPTILLSRAAKMSVRMGTSTVWSSRTKSGKSALVRV